MEAGLPLPEPVPVAETTTADGTYRYRLHADDSITVEKRTGDGGWEPAYIYVAGGCTCPGYAHRSECKHSAIARALLWWWAERNGSVAPA